MPPHRKDRMFGIGEWSKITGLTVKTLRFYHNEGLLVPSFIDPQTGYRHYEASQIETARAIAYLRSLEFPLADIKLILHAQGDTDILALHYDSEYREDDADFEACMPLRRQANVDGISVRSLPAGPCISLLHRGPYDQFGHSYAKILGVAKSKGFEILLPTREIYLKGPGMVFKGNPRNYLTEIQLPIQSQSS